MKRKITQFLMLALALVWAIPQTSAQEYELTVNTTPEWKYTFTTPAKGARGAGVGKDYKIWTVSQDVNYSGSIKSAYNIGSSGISSAFSAGYTSAGWAVANDDALNVIWTPTSPSSTINTLLVWDNPNTPATKTYIDITDYSPGNPYMMSAEGDIINGTGYVWFVVQKSNKIQRLTITNGSPTKLMSWPIYKDGAEYSLKGDIAYVKKYDTGKLFLHDRSNGLYDVTVDDTKATLTQIETSGFTSTAPGSMGGCIKMFKGHKLLFCHTGTNYGSEFMIVDLSDNNKVLATISDVTTVVSAHLYGRIIIPIVNPDNENKLDIYTYKSASCAAKYTITATEVSTYTDPVQNLKATRIFNADATQNAVLTWTAPATGTVSSYTIERNDTVIATVGSDVLTYTDTEALTASTEYKVVPSYSTGTVGTDATVTIAPYKYTAPTNLALTPYDGYARVTVTYNKCSDVSDLYIRYDIIRDDAVIAKGLTQAEYVDTYIPKGDHTYAVEAVYYIADAEGNYNIEIARERSTSETVNVKELNSTLVNYTLEEVYNYEVWDIWDADRINGAKLPDNFNPNVKSGENWIDAEHYRQGALVTDANGKKWWYISQKTNSTTINEKGGTSGGILKISADSAELKNGGNAELLLSSEIKNGQSVGIASDEYGNFLIRGWYQKYDDVGATPYNDAHNFASDLDNVVVYNGANMSEKYVVDLSSIDFNTDPGNLNNGAWDSERIDYYRVSGNLMGTSYLYVVSGYRGSRTYTKVQMIKSGDAITVGGVEQYTPTTLDNGAVVKVNAYDGAENYAFPIDETNNGSKGIIYQKRSLGYLYVPEALTSNKDIYTTAGKVANTGGTTAKMSNAKDISAAQLFLITPQSFHSRNAGSFTVGLVPNNSFDNAVIPIANFVQKESDNFDVNAEANNANANWLFAEWDEGDTNVTGDENLYIYQYVPGIRIAKYRLYGNIGFYDTTPVLTINTAYDETEGDITHFTATATWSTPASYNGPGDYAIKHYKVELLDKNNNVIDVKEVKATEGLDAATYESKNYSVTFNTTGDLSNSTGVATGGTSANYFVDDNSLYTVRVTTVYDLRQVMQGTTTASSDLRNSATQTAQAEHSYTPIAPVPSAEIYKGNDGTSVAGLYRIEIGLETPLSTDEKVSHYELYYTRGKRTWTQQTDGSYKHTDGDTTVRVTDFILVTSSSSLEGQDVIPGDVVRNGQSGKYLGDSTTPSYAVFFYDSNNDHGYDTEGNEWWNGLGYDPTEWTYTVKAVYADDNALLRQTTEASITPTPGDYTPTGVEEITDATDGLKAYPIPADTELNVMSGQAIETVGIYSTSGAEVKRVAGTGEMRMTIDVEDLASGYYFLKVNNLPMVKIIVK